MDATNRLGNFSEFCAGARDKQIPMMIGAAPFGVIFGTLCSAGSLKARVVWPTDVAGGLRGVGAV